MQIFKNEIMFEPSRQGDNRLLTTIVQGLRYSSPWPPVEAKQSQLRERFEPGSGEQPTSYAPISISPEEALVAAEALGTIIAIDKARDGESADIAHPYQIALEELQDFKGQADLRVA